MISFFLFLIFICNLKYHTVLTNRIGYEQLRSDNNKPFDHYFKIKPSVNSWDTVATPRRFAITSMVVDHHSEGSWYMRALHQQHSVGWNRTAAKGFSDRPFACNIRFFGVGLESTLEGFQEGGTGYLAIGFPLVAKKRFWHGFDKNETNKLHCYYSTNKDTGSEFLDKPKTLGLAIYCPVALDDEVGPFDFSAFMQQGFYCRALAEYPAEVEVHLRPSEYPRRYKGVTSEIMGEVISNPAEKRGIQAEEQAIIEYRPFAVCVVQTFKNPQTGPMLWMFVAYYQLLGWRVIIYDRFGLHEDFLGGLKKLPGVDYYPFTLYQLAQPGKYNDEYKKELDTEFRSFYKMEVNWGYSSKKLADTADQDADKTRTYDYCRLEYSHLDAILYIDADELLYCPAGSTSFSAQKHLQMKLMRRFKHRGVEEMRFVRIPYSGLAPPGYPNDLENRTKSDYTPTTLKCMNSAYEEHSLQKMAQCWSSATSYDNFPKSADFAGICPFHYNHWSCDGMRGGGRDFTKNRCRCKVAFDMQNYFEYRPLLNRCHIIHLNDNKYKFQGARSKFANDKGDLTEFCPINNLFKNQQKN